MTTIDPITRDRQHPTGVLPVTVEVPTREHMASHLYVSTHLFAATTDSAEVTVAITPAATFVVEVKQTGADYADRTVLLIGGDDLVHAALIFAEEEADTYRARS